MSLLLKAPRGIPPSSEGSPKPSFALRAPEPSPLTTLAFLLLLEQARRIPTLQLLHQLFPCLEQHSFSQRLCSLFPCLLRFPATALFMTATLTPPSPCLCSCFSLLCHTHYNQSSMTTENFYVLFSLSSPESMGQ